MNIHTPGSRQSIFLAGPTLRDNPKDFTTWREQAAHWFRVKGYQGNLYIPEPFRGDYEQQILWEEKHLEDCDCIMFWIPRDMKTLPGLTTNVEFGDWMKSGKVVLGFPKEAEHISYLEYKAKKYGIPIANYLIETVELAIKMAQDNYMKGNIP